MQPCEVADMFVAGLSVTQCTPPSNRQVACPQWVQFLSVNYTSAKPENDIAGK